MNCLTSPFSLADPNFELHVAIGEVTVKKVQSQSKYANRKLIQTSYLIAIVTLALSFKISKIFAVELSVTLTLTFRIGQGEM